MKKTYLFACLQHCYNTSKFALKNMFFKSSQKPAWTVTVPAPLAVRESQQDSQEPPSRRFTFGFDLSFFNARTVELAF